MFNSLLKLPERLEFEGHVQLDISSAKPHLAPAPGEVVHCRPKQDVARGDVVMSIRGSRYISAQKRFLRALLIKGKSSKAFATAGARLKQLKFATSQINEIARTRIIIDPVPVLTLAGIVTDALPAGSTFRKSERLFSLLSSRYVEIAVEQRFAEFLRSNKQAEISHFGSGDYAYFVERGAPNSSGRSLCKFRLESGRIKGDFDLCIRFKMWEKVGPTTTYNDHPYEFAPRGSQIYKNLASESALHQSLSQLRPASSAAIPSPPMQTIVLPALSRPTMLARALP